MMASNRQAPDNKAAMSITSSDAIRKIVSRSMPSAVPDWVIRHLYATGDSAACMQAIDDCIASGRPDSSFLLTMKGLCLRQDGKLTESLEWLKKAMAADTQDLATVKHVARGMFLLGQFESAILQYSKCDQSDLQVHLHSGECLMRLNRYNEAQTAFRRALPLEQAFLSLSRSQSGDEALQTLLSASEVHPYSLPIQRALGTIQDDLESAFSYASARHHDTEAALIAYRRVAQHAPDSPELWTNVAACLLDRGKLISAGACAARAIYLDPFGEEQRLVKAAVDVSTGNFVSAKLALGDKGSNGPIAEAVRAGFSSG